MIHLFFLFRIWVNVFFLRSLGSLNHRILGNFFNVRLIGGRSNPLFHLGLFNQGLRSSFVGCIGVCDSRVLLFSITFLRDQLYPVHLCIQAIFG